MACQLGEPRIRGREDLPDVAERNTHVEKIKQGHPGAGLSLGCCVVVHAVGDVAVLEMLEGDEVGVDNACVLERAGLFPPEGLASGESEWQGQLRFAETERDPFGLSRGSGFFGVSAVGFGDEERWF